MFSSDWDALGFVMANAVVPFPATAGATGLPRRRAAASARNMKQTHCDQGFMEFSVALKQPFVLAALGTGGAAAARGAAAESIPRNPAMDEIAQEIVQDRENAAKANMPNAIFLI